MSRETSRSTSLPVEAWSRSGVANALRSGVMLLALGPLACSASSDTEQRPLGRSSAASGAVAGGGGQGVFVEGSAGAQAGGPIGAATAGSNSSAGRSAAGAPAVGGAGGGLVSPGGGAGGTMGQGSGGATGSSGGSNANPTCTNMTNLLFFIPGATMRPGEACLSCHDGGKGPKFEIAGTVFPMAHDQDDCNGVNGTTDAVKIAITDSAGKTANLDVNLAGNFYYQGPLTPPYQAKVVRGTAEHMMLTKQMSGDCNGCHTLRGVSGAPGRIVAP